MPIQCRDVICIVTSLAVVYAVVEPVGFSGNLCKVECGRVAGARPEVECLYERCEQYRRRVTAGGLSAPDRQYENN